MKNKLPRELGFGVRLAAVCAFGAITVVTASATTITFAQYNQASSTNQLASGMVNFTFLVAGTIFGEAPQLANFSLTAASTQIGNCAVACGGGDTLTQYGYAGTFSFTDAAGGLDPGALLLMGTFAVTGSPATTGAQFSSSMGGSGGSFDASATAGNLNQLVLTSAFLNFSNQTEEDSSFSLSSLNPNFAVGTITNDQAYPGAGPFLASGTGTFSSNPGPSTVPEPGTVCLMAGAGLIGIGLARRRKRFDQV
jgi:hypothetical protein